MSGRERFDAHILERYEDRVVWYGDTPGISCDEDCYNNMWLAWQAATAAAKATITEAVCKEAYERGVAAMPCYWKWLSHDGNKHCRGDATCPRCAAIRARTPSPACETAGEEE